MIVGVNCFRAAQHLQQAVYALIVAGNRVPHLRAAGHEAAVSNMRLAAHDLGFDLVPRPAEKLEAAE